jgi:hypothetical protein
LIFKSYDFFAKAFNTTGCAATVFSLARFSPNLGIYTLCPHNSWTAFSRGPIKAGVAPVILPLFKKAVALIATTSLSTRAPVSLDQSFTSVSIILSPKSSVNLCLIKRVIG